MVSNRKELNDMETRGIQWSERNRMKRNGMEMVGSVSTYIIHIRMFNRKCDHYCERWSKILESSKSKSLVPKLLLTSEVLLEA